LIAPKEGLAVFKDVVLIFFEFAIAFAVAVAVAVAATLLVATPEPAFFVSLAHRSPLCKFSSEFSSAEFSPRITTLQIHIVIENWIT
jgi:hypothetical protein